MKTKLSVAAMALLLASCSSNDNDLLPENPVNATPIQVSQSVQGMVKTRAAVGVGSDVTATVLVWLTVIRLLIGLSFLRCLPMK